MYSHTFTFEDGNPFTTGCTSVVTATIEGDTLGPYDVLVDICVAQKLLREVCSEYDHKNLDELAEFEGRNTTVEVVAKAVYDKLLARLSAHHKETLATSGKGFGSVTCLKITLDESDVASAAYWDNCAQHFA